MMRGGPTPSWTYEEAALQRGFRNIGGVDEAGRGPLAGPVVAACVVLPAGTERPLVRDSKSLSPAARDRAYASIVDAGAAVGVGQASATEIDDANILRATHTAMLRAIEACPVRPDYVLVDGLPVPLLTIPNRAVVKGDVLCVSIASASIVAKVTRDRMMSELDRTFPGYGFATHKGYPTPEHMAALEAMGPCPAHRRSFHPVAIAEPGCLFHAPVQARAGATGQTGEVWARVYLERIGHRILATGFRHGRAEIDIVSEEGSVLVFTEVKACAGGVEDTPSARLSAAQRQRIGLAAEGFMAERGMDDRPCRFDVIEVLPGRSRVPRLRHFRGAFMLDG